MRIVTVLFHHDPDGWWAESPDVPGYTAAAADPTELSSLVHQGLREFLDEQLLINEVGGRVVASWTSGAAPLAAPPVVPNDRGRNGNPLVLACD